METYLHDPMDCSKTLKQRFRVRDLDLPEKRGISTSRGEEEEDSQIYPCGKAIESRNYMVGECETYKEERKVPETRKTDESDIKVSSSCCTLVDGEDNDKVSTDIRPKKHLTKCVWWGCQSERKFD